MIILYIGLLADCGDQCVVYFIVCSSSYSCSYIIHSYFLPGLVVGDFYIVFLYTYIVHGFDLYI